MCDVSVNNILIYNSISKIFGQTVNSGLWTNGSSPISVFVCREQELKVYQARRSLEEALMADGLARTAENTRELLEGKAA